MDPLRALVDLGGAAHADALFGVGVAWPDLRAALERNQIVRPARGTYALPQLDRGRVAAAALRGQLGCVSACAFWGIKSVGPPDTLHIVIPQRRSVAAKRVRGLQLFGVHRESAFETTGLVEGAELALDHAARCTRPIEQLVLVDSALHLGRLDPLAVHTFACGDQRRREWLARLATRASHSVPESVAHAVLDAAGFMPRSQDANDGVGHVDLGVGSRHGVEVDGYETHSDKASFAEDRRRDREMAALKKWPLRYTYPDVMKDPRAFGLDVARIIGIPVAARYEQRMRWLMAVPPGHLNRRTRWNPPGS